MLSVGRERFAEAERCFEEALALARPHDARVADAVFLAAAGRSACRQGDLQRARRLARRALAASRALGRRADEGEALRDLGTVAHHGDDAGRALQLGNVALRIAAETGRPRGRRDALVLVGHANAALGQSAAAAEAFQEARALDRAAGAAHLEIEAVAGLARVALAQGDLLRAAAHASEVLDFLSRETAEGAEDPVGLYLTVARVLEALGDVRAPRLLDAAYLLLEERGADLDEAERRDFFRQLPVHRAVVAAWTARHCAGVDAPAAGVTASGATANVAIRYSATSNGKPAGQTLGH